MKTQLVLDYEKSKAFQYYFSALGQLQLDNTIDEHSILEFFEVRNEKIPVKDALKVYSDGIRKWHGIDQILTSMTLFDSIRISPCNDDVFMGYPGVKIEDEKFEELGLTYGKNKRTISDEIVKETIDLLKLYKSRIVDAALHDDSFIGHYVTDECTAFDDYIYRKMYLDALKNYDKKPVKTFLKKLDPLPSFDDWMQERDYWNGSLYRYELYLDKAFMHIYNSLSLKEGYSLSDRFDIPNEGHSLSVEDIKKSCDKINVCMALLEFGGEDMMIPKAETLEDVIELRKDPRMISFRQEYAQWVSYLREGDVVATYKMWKDVIKAKKEIDKITKFKKIDGNILTRGLFMIGSEIPVLAEILNGYAFVSGIVVDGLEKKYRWCNLPGLTRTNDYFKNK